MTEENYDIDLEMLGDFIDESLEAIAPIPEKFIKLEEDPSNIEIIQEIFRPIHSLKGNAGYFGLMKTKALAHEMESVLDRLRKEKLAVSQTVIDALLSGIDIVVDSLENSRGGQEHVVLERWQQCLDVVHTILEKEQETPEQANARLWRDTLSLYDKLKEGLDEDPEHMAVYAEIKAKLISLAPDEFKPQPQQGASEGGNSPIIEAMLAVAKSEELSDQERIQETRSLIDALMAEASDSFTQEIALKLKEEASLFLDRIGWDAMVVSLIEDTADAWRQHAPQQAEISKPAADEPEKVPETPAVVETEVPSKSEPEPRSEPKTQQTQPEAEPVGTPSKDSAVKKSATEAKEVGRTMRVSEQSIDAFLGFVGELIAVDEMFRHIHNQFVKQDADIQLCSSLLRVINIFSKLSDDLQRSIMEIRKVSVKPLLQKNSRIARDVAVAANKEIETMVEGTHIHIDRSLIETLESPMVHMVRNAADHGIEPPQERSKKGKSPRGKITVRFEEKEDEIILIIADDGKGLDYEKIRQKAIKQGLLSPSDPITQVVLQEFIFSSGFSTAEQVTDVSGRGVGMEAVRTMIENAGGSINVESEKDRGTRFIIRLPKSVGTQILPSFVVKVMDERYVIPMDRIRGSFRPKPQSLNRFPDGTVGVRLSGNIYPVISLQGVYDDDLEALTEKILIRIESKTKPFTILVDDIIGIQKVVLRNVPWIEFDKFLGSAVMGDGFVSMIINVNALEKLL